MDQEEDGVIELLRWLTYPKRREELVKAGKLKPANGIIRGSFTIDAEANPETVVIDNLTSN